MSASEVETKARSMGWKPKEEFTATGRPEGRWVDAETYVERGEQILPILQSNNKKLLSELNQVRTQNQQIAAQLASATESIEALKDLRTTLNVDRVKQEKAGILEDLKEAKRSGDMDAEVALTDKLSEANAALKEAAKPVAKPPAVDPPAPSLTAEASEWMAKNPWFGNSPEQDAGKTGYAMGLARAWKAAGKQTGTQEFFDHVDEKIAEVFDPNRRRRESGDKVNGTTNSEHTDGGRPKHTFSDLPREAKEAFERQATKLVGKGKVYETKEALMKVYVEQYDWSEK